MQDELANGAASGLLSFGTALLVYVVSGAVALIALWSLLRRAWRTAKRRMRHRRHGTVRRHRRRSHLSPALDVAPALRAAPRREESNASAPSTAAEGPANGPSTRPA